MTDDRRPTAALSGRWSSVIGLLKKEKSIGKRRFDSGGGHDYRQTAQRIFQSATGQY